MAKPSTDSRDRLLRQATELFYFEGIHAVGIDRIVAEAQSTRATLYRYWPGKEDLIVAYLQAVDEQIRSEIADVVGGTPADSVRRIAASIVGQITGAGFRGCAFLNAATEYPQENHPIHQLVIRHRAWFLETLTDLFGDEATAWHFVMLRDGAMTAGCVSDSDAVKDTFLAAVEGILRTHAIGASSPNDG